MILIFLLRYIYAIIALSHYWPLLGNLALFPMSLPIFHTFTSLPDADSFISIYFIWKFYISHQENYFWLNVTNDTVNLDFCF